MNINPIYILAIVVGLSAVVLLGINLYYTLRSRRNTSTDQSHYSILHQRLDSFSDLLNKQLESNRQSSEKASLAVHQQVQGFTQNMTQLHESLKTMQDSVKNVVSFQDIFKSPKLRGNWGEMSLESSLQQYFPKDLYEMQHYFKSGEAVDAILKLPNDFILPIDSKFNWENFEKMVNADNDIHRDGFKKVFFSDVKKKIDEISSKYILPSEGTTDFALMFVPAETVYYELINNIKDVDVTEYARKKKVMLVSPNTFFLSVSAVHHWYRDVQISQKTQGIIKKLQTIVTDGSKLADDFRRLGSHISNTKSAYDQSEKRLDLLVGRVKKVVEIGEGEENQDKIDAPVA